MVSLLKLKAKVKLVEINLILFMNNVRIIKEKMELD